MFRQTPKRSVGFDPQDSSILYRTSRPIPINFDRPLRKVIDGESQPYLYNGIGWL